MCSSSISALSITEDTLSKLRATLLNVSGTVPLAHRFRALFTLKSFGKSTAVLENGISVSDAAIKIIAEGFSDPSALLKHELAYVLGQMSNHQAVPVLEQVLETKNQDPMVRHEAAEALGALSSTTSEPMLRRYLHDEERCVRETCEIALARIEWFKNSNANKQEQAQEDSDPPQFTSVDPAPPSVLPPPSSTTLPEIQQLRSTLISRDLPLFERYRAMFALRNIAGRRQADTEKTAVEALAAGLSDDSELFKHEIAFVFGQLSTPHSIPALLNVLRNDQESSMVRHEAAEALGGIVGEPLRDASSEPVDVLAILKEFSQREDAPRVVRESCIVAIDMWEYENSDQFQYANGLDYTTSNATPEDMSSGNVSTVGRVAVGA